MKLSIRKKLLLLIVGLSLALIVASVLISSRFYAASVENNMKALCLESAESLTEHLESDSMHDFLAEYFEKVRSVYEKNREELEAAAGKDFDTYEKREEYYDQYYDGIFPPRQGIGMSWEMLNFKSNYEALQEKMDILSYAGGMDTSSIFYYDQAHDNMVYLVDRAPEGSSLYHFPISVEKPKEAGLRDMLKQSAQGTVLEDSLCYGLTKVNGPENIFVIFGNHHLDIQKNVRLFSLYTFGITLGATLVIGLVVLLFANKLIVRNVKKLTAASEQFTSGMKGHAPQRVSASIDSRDEIGNLSKQFDLMQDSILGYVESLAEKTAQEERMNAELALAARIQSESLPKESLRTGSVLLDSFLKPAREVGGDLYDYFMLDDRRLFFCLADVSGKGIPAALFMMRAKALIKGGIMSRKTLGEFAFYLNNELCAGNEENVFITAFFGILDTVSGQFSYLRAGHEQPFLKRGTEVRQFSEESNYVLGLFEDSEFAADELQLEPGDTILMFTDGLNEGINEQKEEFGYERIAKTLRDAGSDICGDEYNALVDFCGAEEQFDDVTMLALSLGKTRRFELDDPTYDDIPAVTDEVLAELSDVSEDHASEVGLMIDEIMNNEISYAFEEAAHPHISVILERSRDDFSLTFEDNGIAFDPLREVTEEMLDQSEGGFGLSLVKAFSDKQSYERAGDLNRLKILKVLKKE